MRKTKLDRLDFLVAFGLFASVTLWAFVWAHPCPHPDVWPFLVAVQDQVGVAAFGVAGRFALGVFAASCYLVLRGFWFLHRDREDELPDNFLYTRLTPMCGAAVFALLPQTWREGQFLSPGFAQLVLVTIGFCLWLSGRHGRSLLPYSSGYFLLGFVCGLSPLGFAPLGYIAVSDAIVRWKDGLKFGQREDDAEAERKKSIETWFSAVAGCVGLLFGICLVVWFPTESVVVPDFIARVLRWWDIWTTVGLRAAASPSVGVLALSIVFAVGGLAIGRRLRAVGRHGLMMCRMLSGVLLVLALAMLLQSVDRAERARLRLMREYASLVADDVRGAKFLFTDGRFDDLLRLREVSGGIEAIPLNTIATPSPDEAARLAALAPELGDRTIFEAGGAEVFKAWVRERPDRLAESAWQLGGGIVRRHGKVQARTHGSVLRCADAAGQAAADAADRRFVEWTERIRALAERRPATGPLFGGTDRAVAEKFDALLWRAARLAGERSERMSAVRNVTAAEHERQTMRRLDELNASLRVQGEVVERMLQTGKLICTPREALDVALKRADFTLARRYAGEILAGDPNDSAANFAVGMANLEAKEYFQASVCFEKALIKNPKEPAALNNLAIAYLKLGKGEKALECAERAAEVHPKSVQIQRTLDDIRKNVRKE